MALDGPASKDTKFGATPDVETHAPDAKKDQEVTVKDAPATPKMEEESNKPKAEEKKADATGKKPDEPKKDKPKNEGPNPPKKDDDGEKPQKSENDGEEKKLLTEIRDLLTPQEKPKHPLMKKLDEDMKAYSNRTAEFRAGYEFGYKVSYGVIRAVEMAFKATKWAVTPKKAESGVTAVQGSAAGLSGNTEKIIDKITELLDKKEADKKGPEQKKDQDKKPEGPKKDDNTVAKTKFGGGVIEGVKSVIEQVKKKDPETPKQKNPRTPKGKSFG